MTAGVVQGARAGTLTVALGLFALACGPRHIESTTPKHRDYAPGGYAQRDPSTRPSNGSLFSEAVPGYLEDTRAVRVGDLVVIRIDESADARGGATTHLQRDSNTTWGAGAFFGLTAALQRAYPALDPSKLLDLSSHSQFDGDGSTARNGTLQGSIAVRVVRQMPNSDLFVEGTKVILINNEECHLYLSGLIRRADIEPDNSVASSRIADAQIEFTGRGDVTEHQRRGWLQQLLDAINPF
jgi:flagellar L-ring protein FlgH